MKIRAFFFFFSLLFYFSDSIYAQGIEARFASSVVLVDNAGSILFNTLSVANKSDDTARFHFVPVETSIRLFNAKVLTVAPHASALQVVKCMLPRQDLYAGFPVYLWIISDKGDTAIAQFKIDMALQRNVQMNTTELSPVINNLKETLHVPVLVRNKGNTSEHLSLYAGDGPNWITEQHELFFSLPAYTDTTVTVDYHFQKRENSNSVYEEQSLAIDLRDSSNASVTAINIRPVIVTNNLELQQNVTAALDNYAAVQFYHNGMNVNTQEYQVAYNKAATENGVVLSMDAYNAGAHQPLTLMNTYIGYKQGMVTTRAGLMNIWGELPIYGQGGNVTIGDSKRFIGVSYLYNANSYLLGDQNAPGNNTRSLYAAGGFDLSGQTSVNGSFLHQWNNPIYKDLYLGGVGFKWQPDLRQSVEASFFGNTGELFSGHEQGAAARLRWRMHKSRWQLFSDNYYSTPEYAGLMKKTMQFSELINYLFSGNTDSWGLGMVANYVNSDPYTYNVTGIIAHNLQENGQYGVNIFKTAGKYSFRFMPYYSSQKTQFSNSPFYELNGFYTALDMGYNSLRFSIGGSLTTALSYVQNQVPARNDNDRPVRLQLQARYKFFYIQGLVQNHAFFATDLIQEATTGKPFSMYSVGPGVRVPLLQQKLELSANYNLQYWAGNPLPYQYVSGSVVANLFQNWQLTGSCSYSFTNGIAYQDIRVGVRFLFHRPADFFVQKKSMIFFNDANQNGKRDQGEALLKGIVYGSNQQMAQSDADGRIKISHYTDQRNNDLGIINGNGYLPVRQIDQLMFKGTKKFIPMYKLGVVSGKVSLSIPKYYTRTVSAAGLPLIFTNESGKDFTCYVMTDGSFNVSLPAGKYEVKISAEFSDIFQLKQEKVTVTPQKIESVNLEVKYKTAQMIDVIQFTGKK
ncbi:hypothetical protein [Taibaiella soli]|uniref:SD-repeat containing protein B domain-containing protein n=1 Tax=Taibaiella soli TaxID=1649169 RepID=A0A2W2ABH1_9BACT|nr:hypothetical protein [Taibaiella soli]PZF72661.1 hypothetical protein DN068_12410 [Taibaiella soli]